MCGLPYFEIVNLCLRIYYLWGFLIKKIFVFIICALSFLIKKYFLLICAFYLFIKIFSIYPSVCLYLYLCTFLHIKVLHDAIDAICLNGSIKNL